MIKTIPLFIFLMIAIAEFNGFKTTVESSNEHKIIYKIYNKTGLKDTDTLWVFF